MVFLHAASYIPLLTISLLAFVVPVFTARLARIRKIRIPTMIGEIAAGIIIGKSGLNIMGTDDPWVSFLATFGFGYLMFLSGLELDFEVVLGRKKQSSDAPQLRGLARQPLLLAVLYFTLAVGLGYLASVNLVRLGLLEEPWLIALIMATVSLGVVVPVLKDQNYEKTAYGQNLIVISSIADFGSILAVAVLASLYSGGNSLKLLLGLALLLALLVAYQIGLRLRALKITDFLPEATSQVTVRFSFAVILALMAIAESVGIEAILGSFLAGALISVLARDDKPDLQHKLEAIGYGFFIPAFFIMVGVEFDLWALLGSWEALRLVPILLILAFGVKLIAAVLLRTSFSWRETFAGGTLLSAQLSFTIAAAAIGLRLGIIDAALNGALILTALITAILSPIFFNNLLPRKITPEPALIVIGSPRKIQAITPGLETGSMPVKTYEVTSDSFPTVTDLAQLDLNESSKVIIADDDESNYRLARLISENFSPADILVIGSSEIGTKDLQELGVRSIAPTSALIMLVNHLINHPGAFHLLYDQTHSAVTEIQLKSDSPAVGKAIRELRMPTESLILTVVREGNQHIVPTGKTVLEAGDVLYIIGKNKEAADEAAQLLLREGKKRK